MVGNKKNIKNKKGVSLAEVVIATFISVFLLLIISYFTYAIFDRMGKIENETQVFSSIYELSSKINDYRNIYITGGILIDSDTESDVFLMKNSKLTEGILFGPVSFDNHKLSLDNEIISMKTIGFRKISSSEMIEIDNDFNEVFNYTFFSDNMFYDLKIKDLNIVEYNSGKLHELNIIVDRKYNYSNTGKKWNDFSKEYLYKYNINF